MLGRVEVRGLEVSFADGIVVGDDNAGDGGEKDGIRRQVGGEIARARDKNPRIYAEADDSADVGAAADVEVAGQQGGHVGAGRDRVGGNVRAKLGEGESKGDDENAGAGAGTAVIEEHAEDIERVPDLLVEDDGSGGGDDDSNEGGDGEANRDGDDLRP